MDVNDGWKRTCKALLGDEIGDIGIYKSFLEKFVYTLEERKSGISGKNVFISYEDFSKGAKFIGYEESDAYSKNFASDFKLHINEIKDIDSILGAIEDHVCYSGNIVLGNSSEIAGSNRVTNSHFVHSSTDVYDSKYVGFSSRVRYGEHVYGVNASGECRFMIKGFRQHRSSRCMEVHHCEHSSDCFFCGHIDGCQNCLFSFNQRSKFYMIGNLQLSKDEYLKLKEKLVEDIRQTLESKKNIPSIIEIIAGERSVGEGTRMIEPAPVPAEIENNFGNCSKILLGKELDGLQNYKEWLFRHVPEPMKVKSAISEKPVVVARLLFHEQEIGSFLDEQEADEHGRNGLSASDVQILKLSNASELLEKIKQITPEITIRKNVGNVDCGIIANAVGCYFSSECAYCKHVAYSAWPRESEHLFGTTTTFSSQFCMKCYNSVKLSRCFEVSDSNNCSGCYFCHNVENVHDSMFCFNAKNLNYAIGNVEIGREKFSQIKKMVLDELSAKIERGKKLDLSVYNLGR